MFTLAPLFTCFSQRVNVFYGFHATQMAAVASKLNMYRFSRFKCLMISSYHKLLAKQMGS